jgi:serine/threonine-protein kinase
MPFSNGLQIGPYRVLEQLGQGGMATVYKAYHASLDRYVAVKVLHQAFMEDPNFLARFQREARLVARLEHPNIVPIYDYAEHEGQPYLIMKYIEGETLKARLQHGPLNATEVQTVIEAVGAALAYAHKQGILHRDIKPSNVILAKDGNIYLADFGLARIAQSGESTLTTDMILGTPQYISPEQAMAKKDLDAGTDIYSLGVMVYEMTVGRVPFSADTPFSVIHDHIYAPLPLPSTVNPKISPELERVLLKALAKDRADRYVDVPAFVEAFKQAWTNSASTVAVPLPDAPGETPAPLPAVSQASAPLTLPAAPQAVSQPPVPPAAAAETVDRPRKKKSRGRWMWLAVLVALCLCCSVVFFATRSRNTPPEQPPAPETANPPLPLETAIPTQVPPPVLPPAQATPAAPLPPETAQGEKIDLPPMDLGAAKEAVAKNPEDPRARLVYGFTLIRNQQKLEGYQEIKKSSELGAKNSGFLTGAARALDKADLALGTAIMEIQLANLAGGLAPRQGQVINNLRRSVYYGFAEEFAPAVLEYGTLGKIDEILSLIAQARHTIVNRNDPGLAKKLIDELRSRQPNLPEADLLHAELLIVTKQDLPGAQKILAGLLQTAKLPDWVIARAKELQASAK